MRLSDRQPTLSGCTEESKTILVSNIVTGIEVGMQAIAALTAKEQRLRTTVRPVLIATPTTFEAEVPTVNLFPASFSQEVTGTRDGWPIQAKINPDHVLGSGERWFGHRYHDMQIERAFFADQNQNGTIYASFLSTGGDDPPAQAPRKGDLLPPHVSRTGVPAGRFLMDNSTQAVPAEAVSKPLTFNKADIHMHTNLGDGWASPARVIQEATRRQLTLIAVTDHDHLEGAKRVEELLARQNSQLQLVTGVEVSTRQGHLLGLFVQKAPKPGRPVEESIEAIKAQGGLVVVPHPLGRLVPSLSRKKIDSLLAKGYAIDGIEVYNPTPANASQRATVRSANQDWQLAETGGSDAHFWQHIGAAYTLFPGTTPEDLRQAILERTVRAGGQEQPPVRLNPGVYVAQCAWSWFVDPPRRVARRRREAREERQASQS